MLVLAPARVVLAQSPVSAARPTAPDTASLGHGPYAHMHTLLEKTIFKVDVLTVDVRLGREDVRRLEALAGGRYYSPGLADSIAEVAIHSRDAWVRVRFLRGVSLKHFLDGVDDNLILARDAGTIADGAYRIISEGLPRWFGFLEERGIRKGDQIEYRIRGDTLNTRYWAASGQLMLDQTDVGPERRLAVLGSYFAARSDFREGLIESLFPRGRSEPRFRVSARK